METLANSKQEQWEEALKQESISQILTYHSEDIELNATEIDEDEAYTKLNNLDNKELKNILNNVEQGSILDGLI